MTNYQNKEVPAGVLAPARRAREIYLATVPRTKATPWEDLSAEERHAWIPYAMAACEAVLGRVEKLEEAVRELNPGIAL